MYKEMKSKKEFQATHVAQMILNLLKDQEGLIIDYELKSNTFYTASPFRGPWRARQGAYLQSIRALVRKYIRAPQYGDPTWDKEHYINETISAIKDLLLSNSAKEERSFDLHENQDRLKQYIVVDGQLLDWRNNNLLPWSPDYKATINFVIGFDDKADCPHWRQYMREWLPDEGSRLLLQEFLGYCLIPDTKLETFLILTGSGSNGKSMLLNYVKTIFQEACSSLNITKMTERFGVATLLGRLINICTEDEGEGGYLKHTDQIKALVSGEELVAEFKGKDPFTFKNSARFIFATNNIPKTKDRSHGWYRRQIIINFPIRFTKDMNKAREMEYYMKEEKAGIFNWMLEGLRNVMSRGDLIIPESVQHNQDEFKAINDPLEGFLRECTSEMNDEDYIKYSKSGALTKRIGLSTSILYKIYEFWCDDNYGEKAKQLKMVQRNFTERIHKEKGIEKERGYCIIRNDNKQQCFFGIMLDIKDNDLRERMTEAFKGFGAAEPESIIRDFVLHQNK
jgi:P4 family phage/plasmid primase-like protien